MGTRVRPAIIVCAICQKPFETEATRVRYCPDCRRIAKRLTNKRYAMNHPPKPKTKEPLLDLGDTPRQRKICLSCELPVEKCKGNCDRLWEV